MERNQKPQPKVHRSVPVSVWLRKMNRLRNKEKKMTRTNKILLSTITTLALLLSGCTDGGTEAGDVGTENPVPPIAETPIRNQHTVNLASAPITIGLDGVYDVKYKEDNGTVSYKESTDVNSTKRNALNLVDVDNATSYTLDELAAANLNMDGSHTRTFRWVLGSVDSSDYRALAKTTSTQTAKSTESSDEDGFTETTKTTGTFGLPPQ